MPNTDTLNKNTSETCEKMLPESMNEQDDNWSESIAELITDALITAKVISIDQSEKTLSIIKEEIFVRLIMDDRPTNPNYDKS